MGKTVKEQILNNEVLMQACKITDVAKKPNTIFSYFFKDIVLDNGYTKQAINGVDIIHFEHKNGISDKDYLAIFGYNKGNISNKEYTSRVVLIDSTFAYWGIDMRELEMIRSHQGEDQVITVQEAEQAGIAADRVGYLNEIRNGTNQLFDHNEKAINGKFKTQALKEEEHTLQPASVVDNQSKPEVVTPESGAKPTEVDKQPTPQIQTDAKENTTIPEATKAQKTEVKKTEMSKIRLTYVEETDENGNRIISLKIEDGRYSSQLSQEELKSGNIIIPCTNATGKEEKTFIEICATKYNKLLEGESNGASFLEIATGTPGIEKATEKAIRSKGSYQNLHQDGNTVHNVVPNELQIEERDATRLKFAFVSILNRLLQTEGIITGNKDINKTFDPEVRMTIKQWIEQNVRINGKPATVEDVVTKVVEILGIKDELEINHLEKNGKNPTVLVRALESDAGLKDILKDNIKEIENTVKEKGLKAGYAYIETLYKNISVEIEPLLTKEQKKVFENLLNTKKEVEKAENKKIEKQGITDTIKSTGAKLLENRFKELGLYKPLDPINSPLHASVKLICDEAKKSGIKNAIKYIPVLLKNTKDGLKEEQVNGLIEICKNFNISLLSLKICFDYEKDTFKKEGDKLLNKVNKDAVKQLKDGIDEINEQSLSKKAKKEIKNKINEKSPAKIVEILTSYSVAHNVNFGNLITDYEKATIARQAKNTEILDNAKKKEKEKFKKISIIIKNMITKEKTASKNISDFFNTISELDANREAREAEAERKANIDQSIESIKATNVADFFDYDEELSEKLKTPLKELKEKAEAERLAKEKAEAEAKAEIERKAEKNMSDFFNTISEHDDNGKAKEKAEVERKVLEATTKLKAKESLFSKVATRVNNFGLTLLKGTLDIATVGLFHKKLFKGRE